MEKNDCGFTLVEVLAAIFIISIGVFGVMALFPVGIHQTDKIVKNTVGGVSSEIPLAYLSYKYPAGNTGGADYDIQEIVTFISGTATPACYFYPSAGVGTITGNAMYGWTSAVVPVDMDTPGNGTATAIGETYLFRQQTAIYKNYAASIGTATFTYKSTTVSNVSNINQITLSDYICNAQNHIWYRVTAVHVSLGNVTIKQPYEYETASSAACISTKTIVGIYDTLLTAH